MKTSVSRRLLSFALILCMIIPMLPVIEFTASSASTPTYIASIGITQKGSADAAKSALSGHTIIDRDLNEGAEGDYVYMGYKTTNDPYQAITGIVFQVGKNPPASISYGGCTFNLVGGSEETNTSSQGGWIDLNGAAGGDYIYTYVTRDHNYGAPLTTMTVDESSSKSGYSTGTDTSGSVIDLNKKAGGKYLYLHYKRYSATVTINFYHLNDAGKVVVTQVSGTVKHHLEEMKGKPSVPGLVTYDEKPLRRISWREDPSIENQGTSLVSSPSATVATSGKNYYATYGFLTDTLAIYPDTIIRFDANGGSGAPSELRQKDRRDVTAGTSSLIMGKLDFTLPDDTCTKAGTCKFLGWSTDKNATKATYAPGQSISIDHNTTLYAIYEPTNYVNGVCTYCGKIQDGNVAVLSKNGKEVFAGATLDAVITEAEKCTADDKAVVTILQDIDLGSNYQRINSGVFTIDLNGCKLSYDSGMNATLGIYNSGTDITLISSRTGGTVENRHYIGVAIYTYNNANLTATGISVIGGSEGNGILLNDGNASLTDVTVQAGVGIWVRLLRTQNKLSLTCTNCTVQATFRALRVDSDCTATITGGRLQGDICDIDSLGTTLLALDENGVGTTFSSGINVAINVDGNKRLNNILADGAAYWAGDTMLEPADNAYSITDKGDITVKAACTHSSFTKQNYVNNGDYHTYTRSCCKTTVTEDHTFVAGNCICGLTCSHASGFTNGFCIENGCYQPAELVDGYYQIANGGNLFWFAEYINTVDRTASAKLTADIDLEDRLWTPIGSTGEGNNNFRGHFDGQGYTITGLNVNANRAGAGFFGEVRLGTVENFTIYGNVTVTANNITYVGGVIGSAPGANSNQPDHNGATIRNITSYVDVTVEDDKTGVGRIGGFIGYANHETIIENCAWYGTIDLGNQAMTLGAGGFIGRVNENSAVTIRNCGAYGSIVNDSVTENVGAFMGLTNTGTNTVIENCLFAGSVSGTNASSVTPFGTWNGASKTLTNSYYINTLGTTDADAAKVTADQLASGEVAYKLGSAWGQTIGTEDYPVLGGEKVYQVCNCKNETAYSNTDADTGHSFGEDGKCTACGALLGDVSGEGRLTALDLALINAYVKEKIAFTPEVLSVADFDRDGFVTSADVDSLKEYILYN